MKRQRFIILFSILYIIPLGFYTKFYSGPAENWVNDSFGGLLYEIFWCLVIASIFVKAKPIKIALWVFVFTCMLEFLQLWHPAFLEFVRSNFIGRTILGNSFNWMDFPYYLAGSLAGYLILISIRKINQK